MSSSDDPVSDFLMREQNALADLNIGLDDFADVNSSQSQPQATDDGLNDCFVDQPEPTLTNNASSNPNLEGLASNESPPTLLVNGDIHKSVSVPNNMNGPKRAPEEEPEKIKKWREEQKKKIEEKDKAEEKKKEELRNQAAKELQQWNAQRKEGLELRKRQNREREIKLLDESEANAVDNSKSTWEKIAKMIESSQKSSKGSTVKDLGRMKALIMKRCEGNNQTTKIKTDA